MDHEASRSQSVFILKVKIKRAFALLLHTRLLSFWAFPLDTCVTGAPQDKLPTCPCPRSGSRPAGAGRSTSEAPLLGAQVSENAERPMSIQYMCDKCRKTASSETSLHIKVVL